MRRVVPAWLLLIAMAAATPAPAQRMEPLPEELEGIGIEERPNARLPLDLTFTDDRGREVRLGELIDGRRPAVLTLVYYSCPMLCTLVLNGLTDAMREIDWTPGSEFEVVTVSFDPLETSTLARLKKQSYIEEFGRPEAAPGWHFLVGGKEPIRRLTEAVGFRYRWDEKTSQFAHQAAIFVITPDGRVSRTLYGVLYDPRTLRLSLVEAGAGKIGTPLDQIVLFCFHYDAASGTYAPAAMRIVRAGGILTAVVLGIVLSRLWTRERRRKREATGASPAASGEETER